MTTKKPAPKPSPVVPRPRAVHYETSVADPGKLLRAAKAAIDAQGGVQCAICGGTFTEALCPTDGNKLHG